MPEMNETCRTDFSARQVFKILKLQGVRDIVKEKRS